MSVDEGFRRSVPWRLPDLYLAVALVTTGVILIGVARAGVAGRERLDDQVPWVNIGVGGLIVLCLGCVLWVLAGMRATAELRRAVLRRLRAAMDADHPHAQPIVMDAVGGGELVSSPSMTRYHLADCQLVAGKETAPVGDERNGLQPCAVCLAGADA